MTTSQPTQNLSVCIALMTCSGFLRVVATMVLAYPDFVARQNGQGDSGRRLGYIAVHVSLLAIAAIVSVVGTFYGPVSIAVPVQTGSQLLFNVVFMAIVLKMRAFNKAQRTGTYVVFFSVLQLMDVGPGTQDDQNVLQLLSHPIAAAWAILVSVGLVVAAVGTIQLLRQETRQHNPQRISAEENATTTGNEPENDETATNYYQRNYSFLILLTGVTLSNVAMATSGKALGSVGRGMPLVIAFGYYFIASSLGLLFSITSSTACDQGLFTPASSVALVIVNFVTGIVIWQDYKVMTTWVGYICAVLLMCCGVYLLAESDILERYLVKRTASIVRHGVVIETQDTTITTDPATNDDELRRPIVRNGGDSFEASDLQEEDCYIEQVV